MQPPVRRMRWIGCGLTRSLTTPTLLSCVFLPSQTFLPGRYLTPLPSLISFFPHRTSTNRWTGSCISSVCLPASDQPTSPHIKSDLFFPSSNTPTNKGRVAQWSRHLLHGILWAVVHTYVADSLPSRPAHLADVDFQVKIKPRQIKGFAQEKIAGSTPAATDFFCYFVQQTTYIPYIHTYIHSEQKLGLGGMQFFLFSRSSFFRIKYLLSLSVRT